MRKALDSREIDRENDKERTLYKRTSRQFKKNGRIFSLLLCCAVTHSMTMWGVCTVCAKTITAERGTLKSAPSYSSALKEIQSRLDMLDAELDRQLSAMVKSDTNASSSSAVIAETKRRPVSIHKKMPEARVDELKSRIESERNYFFEKQKELTSQIQERDKRINELSAKEKGLTDLQSQLAALSNEAATLKAQYKESLSEKEALTRELQKKTKTHQVALAQIKEELAKAKETQSHTQTTLTSQRA